MDKLIKLYFWVEKIWFYIPEKTRFLLVGGFNTLVAYTLLLLLNFVFLEYLPYSKSVVANIALIIQYVISINLSFLTMRYYVFRSHGIWQEEYVRACGVYVIIYSINAPIITSLIEFLNWPLWMAQGTYLIISTILTFLLHKYYSFKNNLKTVNKNIKT